MRGVPVAEAEGVCAATPYGVAWNRRRALYSQVEKEQRTRKTREDRPGAFVGYFFDYPKNWGVF
jgi:hypothetical protein